MSAGSPRAPHLARWLVVAITALMILVAASACSRQIETRGPAPSIWPIPAPASVPSSTPPPTSSPGCADWTAMQRLSNSRFGFSVEHPSCMVCIDDELENIGSTCTTDEAQFIAYGSNAVRPEDPPPSPEYTVKVLTGDGWTITYQDGDARAYSVAATRYGFEMVYLYTVVGSGSYVGLQWTYSPAGAALVKEPIAHSIRTLQPGDLSKPH